jgi:hypothetical protein
MALWKSWIILENSFSTQAKSIDRQGLKPLIFRALNLTPEHAAEKHATCHSEGPGSPEESAVSWKPQEKQIPRFARDDKKYFFRGL